MKKIVIVLGVFFFVVSLRIEQKSDRAELVRCVSLVSVADGMGRELTDDEIVALCSEYGGNLKQIALFRQQILNEDSIEGPKLLAHIRCYMDVVGWEGKPKLYELGSKLVALLKWNKAHVVEPFFHPANCQRAEGLCKHFRCVFGKPLQCAEEEPEEPLVTSQPEQPPPPKGPEPVMKSEPTPVPPPVEPRLRDCPLIWDTDTVLIFKENLPDVAPPYFICGDVLLNNWCFLKPGKMFRMEDLENRFAGFEIKEEDLDEDGNLVVDAGTRANLFGFMMQPGKRWNVVGCYRAADGGCEQLWANLDSYTGHMTREYNCNIVRGAGQEKVAAPLTLPVCGQTRRWTTSSPFEQNQK